MAGVGWRWTFLMPAPIAILALVAGMSLIPRHRPASEGGHDVLGALTSTAAMLLLVYALVSAPDRGWADPVTLALFGAVVVLVAAFVLIERRVAHPLVRLGILRKGTLVRANLGIVALLGSYTAFQFIVTLYLQSVLGWRPLMMALALLPAGLLVALSAPFTGTMIDRFGTARFIVGGLVAMSIGYLLFLRVDTHPVYVLTVLPTVLLLGTGFALGFPSINVQATAGVEDDEQGLAAGLVQTAGQVGVALVLAVTTAIITGDDTRPGGHSPAAMLAQYRPGLIFITAVALGGLVVTLVPLLRRTAARPDPLG